MDNGWIKLHRKIINSSVWKNPIIFMVWSWCLMKANHKNSKFPFNGRDIIIKSGQFITGRKKAIQEIPISEQNWKTAINYLKLTSRITTKSTNKFTIITIVKWEQYQLDDKKVTSNLTNNLNNHQPATNQLLTTNKNDKNIKKKKLPYSKSWDIPLREDNQGKWWDISGGSGNWKEFVNGKDDIIWK